MPVNTAPQAPLVDPVYPGLHGGFAPSQVAFVPPTQRALGNLDDGARPLGRVGLRGRVRRTVCTFAPHVANNPSLAVSDIRGNA